MSSEIEFIDTYTCPHCRADLVSGSNGWSGWERCPVCGLASLPPEPEWDHLPKKGPAAPEVVRDVMLIRDAADDNLSDAIRSITPVTGRASSTSPTRLIFKTGLLASIALTFIAFLDHRTTHSLIFGVLAVVFLLLVLGGPGSRAGASLFKAKND